MPSAYPKMSNPVAHFETSQGNVEAEIYLDRVPYTSSNFIDLCRTGFFNGLHFHRVIDGFMCQFGCPYSKDAQSPMTGKGGPPMTPFPNLRTGQMETRVGGVIRDEHVSVDSNVAGTLAMANIGKPSTGGSQFFFNVAHNHNLDWFTPSEAKHPVFGIVRNGMDVIYKISKMKVVSDKPSPPVQVFKVTVTGAPEVEMPKPSGGGRRGRSRSSSSSSSSTTPNTRRKKSQKMLKRLDRLEKKDKRRGNTRVRGRSSSSSSSSSRKRKRRR